MYKSDGKIPDVFLREAGVPEDFITFVPSLLRRAIEFYSCFISYSHHDEEFSWRLHSRMRSENLRVWFAPEDMKGGKRLHEEIFRAIQIHDKLLLVLSENSMQSEWVTTEIRRASKVEREESRRKLFPIRLVDFEAIEKWECFDADSKKDLAIEVREYYIPGPSTIGVDTLFKSDGKIPEVFLRGAGVPEDFITLVPSLVGRATDFYSCFISYSHQDDHFSQRLYSRMQSENLRVWYAPEDMKGGRKLHEEILRAIQIFDKLLLVLSEHSMKSEWVMTEIRRARKVEREENRRILFPIRLVDFDTIRKWECFDADGGKDLAVEVREYYIPDFSNWKNNDAFEAEFAKLLRDLKAKDS